MVNGKIEVEKNFQKFLDKKLKYLSNKNGFLGIDNKFDFKEKVVIVLFGLEKTVSYGGGTKNGPREIIKASHQVELYDEEFNCEPYKKIGIKTLKPFKIDKNINKALKKMANLNKEILNKKLFKNFWIKNCNIYQIKMVFLELIINLILRKRL